MIAKDKQQELKMTLHEIITEALHDPQNWDRVDGVAKVNWNFVDSDLWLHPESKKFSDKEKMDALDTYPENLVPSLDNGGLFVHPFTDMDGVTTALVSLKNPRVTHPLP